MGTDRFCRNCRWVTWPWRHLRDSTSAKCIHPSVMRPAIETTDPVTGTRVHKYPGALCILERLDTGRCGGVEGKNWESRGPREPREPVDDGGSGDDPRGGVDGAEATPG
jgi:hypothetical protein